MARKARVCANCGKPAAGRDLDVRAFYTRKRFPTCGFDCAMAFGQAYRAREQGNEPAMVRARERYEQAQECASERQQLAAVWER